MRIKDVMTIDVRTCHVEDSLRDAARAMGEIDAGVLPVVNDDDELVGMITDRDIVIRAIARGKGPDAPVGKAMSTDVKFCYDTDDVEDVCHNMSVIQLRRLPVVDRDNTLVGIVSLADLARHAGPEQCGEALAGVVQQSDRHNQSNDFAGRGKGRRGQRSEAEAY